MHNNVLLFSILFSILLPTVVPSLCNQSAILSSIRKLEKRNSQLQKQQTKIETVLQDDTKMVEAYNYFGNCRLLFIYFILLFVTALPPIDSFELVVCLSIF
jgi:hypothetical protein